MAELRLGFKQTSGAKRIRLEQDFSEWMESVVVLPFDEVSAEAWSDYVLEHRRAGLSLPVMDSLIAAVAIQHGLTVATANTRHFPGIPTVNPIHS